MPVMAIVFFASITNTHANQLPFQNGEQLNFQIKWSFIPAGTASLIVDSAEKGHNNAVWRFTLQASTYPAINLIYKFKERIDTYTDLLVTHTLFYKKVQSGNTKRDITVNFNWKSNKAQYTNFTEILPPISIPSGILDPLSVFYFIRNQDLQVGQTLERPITDGKKVVMGRLHILKKETIKIRGQAIDTLKLEPELNEVKGVFEKSKNAKMYIWVTDDHYKTPVRLKSKVIVGSFTATLMNFKELNHQPSPPSSKPLD